MELATPLWLWALLALPLLAVVEVWAVRRDRTCVASLVARPLWDRVVERPRELWRWLRLIFVLIGVAGVVLALAQPRWGIIREKVEREGVDVVFVIDTSASMLAEDVQPNRFFVARNALASLLDQLSGDRVALVALEGEAFPLVPLTIDVDAIGLFLETLEPGIVPTPGTSLGAGLARALELFVDPARTSKVVVLVSDGEDLEGGIEDVSARAKELGVVIHTAGVGTPAGSPVPELDRDGKRTGFKHDESNAVVMSRVHEDTLESIARTTGGQYLRLTSTSSSLLGVAAAVRTMEQQSLAREYTYRRKERYQWPLGIGVLALGLALSIPLPLVRLSMRLRQRFSMWRSLHLAALLGLVVMSASFAHAQEQQPTPKDEKLGGSIIDELLFRPTRKAAAGQREYAKGNAAVNELSVWDRQQWAQGRGEDHAPRQFYDRALSQFEAAARMRPTDPRARFNLATALYKNRRFPEAVALFRALGADPASPLAPAARYNLGNSLLVNQDPAGAVAAYRSALELQPDDHNTRHNLELALRALAEQQRQQKEKQNKQERDQDKKEKQDQPQPQSGQGQPTPTPTPTPSPSPEQQQKQEQKKEQERFERETGMSKERAMQLLQALQENEKQEQKKLRAAQRPSSKRGRDW
jgi:Ca-activated chloride channel family protein